MIILKDIQEYDIELKIILTDCTSVLQERFNSDKSLLKLSGVAFEKEVCDTLNFISKDYHFADKFEQTSALAFPDIIVKILTNKWFGIEVKTSQTEWKCFGNSIFESTKIPNIDDRIYIFFGKFSPSQLQCKWAKYEDCIDNINITHSPRYQINMDVTNDSSLSVFHKMNTTYLDFYSSSVSKRMEYVRNFKREGIGQDIALWWLPESETPNKEDEEKLIIKLFSSLPNSKKEEIRYTAMALFPEIFSSAQNKYSRLPTWLASRYGVVMGNIRDLFTAGGQFAVNFKSKTYKIPKICYHLSAGANDIKRIIINTSHDELSLKWNNLHLNLPLSANEKLRFWLDTVTYFLKEQGSMPPNFPTEDWLSALFK